MGYDNIILNPEDIDKTIVEILISNDLINGNDDYYSFKEVEKFDYQTIVYVAKSGYQNNQIFAEIILARRIKQFDDTIQLTYKKMSEFEDPVASSCPAYLLSKLSPTNDKNSANWRKKCNIVNLILDKLNNDPKLENRPKKDRETVAEFVNTIIYDVGNRFFGGFSIDELLSVLECFNP